MGADYGFLLIFCLAVLAGIYWALAPVRPELCQRCTREDATHPHPDGGPGGLCDRCHRDEVRL